MIDWPTLSYFACIELGLFLGYSLAWIDQVRAMVWTMLGALGKARG